MARFLKVGGPAEKNLSIQKTRPRYSKFDQNLIQVWSILNENLCFRINIWQIVVLNEYTFDQILIIKFWIQFRVHDKLNDAIDSDKALRAPPHAPVLHRLKIKRPSKRRRPKAIRLKGRLPLSEVDCRIPVDMDRTQMEIYDYFEASSYGTTVQERSDLLIVLIHPHASLDGIRYCSAWGQGLRNHIKKKNESFYENSLPWGHPIGMR